jgi:hypothetical protein
MARLSLRSNRTQLGHQFFAGVAFIAPALAAEVVLQPGRMPGPVRGLVRALGLPNLPGRTEKTFIETFTPPVQVVVP